MTVGVELIRVGRVLNAILELELTEFRTKGLQRGENANQLSGERLLRGAQARKARRNEQKREEIADSTDPHEDDTLLKHDQYR